MVGTLDTANLIEAEPEDVGLSSKGLANLGRHLQANYIDTGKLAGAVSVVARRGRIVHFETYGRRDAEADKAMEPDTIFRIYSMTKPIASIALMTLYEEGRFQLDDPASRYIPEFKDLKVYTGGSLQDPVLRPPAREMTIADLLRHTSGLTRRNDEVLGPLYEREGLINSSSTGTLREMIEKLGRTPLRCDPGAQWIYSISTDVVGYLCEVLSGQRFDRFLTERIFAPLEMTDSGFHVPAADHERFSANYRPGRAGEPTIVCIDRPDDTSYYTSPRSYLSGSGGLVSTASDYTRFCKMLANGGELDGARVIGSRTLRHMTLNHLPGGRDLVEMGRVEETETKSDGIGFGLGFAVLLDPATAGVIGTPGEFYWGGAASTAFFVSPA